VIRNDAAAASAAVSVIVALRTAAKRSEGAALLLDVLRGREEECGLRYVVRSLLALDTAGIRLDSGIRTHEAFQQAQKALSSTVQSGGSAGVDSVAGAIRHGVASASSEQERSEAAERQAQDAQRDPGIIATALYPVPNTPDIRAWIEKLYTFARAKKAGRAVSRLTRAKVPGSDRSSAQESAGESPAQEVEPSDPLVESMRRAVRRASVDPSSMDSEQDKIMKEIEEDAKRHGLEVSDILLGAGAIGKAGLRAKLRKQRGESTPQITSELVLDFLAQ